MPKTSIHLLKGLCLKKAVRRRIRHNSTHGFFLPGIIEDMNENPRSQTIAVDVVGDTSALRQYTSMELIDELNRRDGSANRVINIDVAVDDANFAEMLRGL